MQTTKQALQKGFQAVFVANTKGMVLVDENNFDKPDLWSFRFGDNEEYELCFEPLLFDEQMYVALYKNRLLLTNKVVVKPGYIFEEDESIH